MCNIAGVVGGRPIAPAAIEEMCDQFGYRGPGNRGLLLADGLPIARDHRRGSILDPSPPSFQTTRASDRYVLACKGKEDSSIPYRPDGAGSGISPALLIHSGVGPC